MHPHISVCLHTCISAHIMQICTRIYIYSYMHTNIVNYVTLITRRLYWSEGPNESRDITQLIPFSIHAYIWVLDVTLGCSGMHVYTHTHIQPQRDSQLFMYTCACILTHTRATGAQRDAEWRQGRALSRESQPLFCLRRGREYVPSLWLIRMCNMTQSCEAWLIQFFLCLRLGREHVL